MRDILFRGKRIDNGEWVEGCFGQHTSLDALIIDRPYPTMNGDLSALGFYEVDPSTVGQYTGRTDKNGKRVFEGDIIRLYNGSVGVVLWSDNDQAYLIFQDPVKMVILDDFGNYGRPEYYEVIGNITDNPELLEGGTDNGT